MTTYRSFDRATRDNPLRSPECFYHVATQRSLLARITQALGWVLAIGLLVAMIYAPVIWEAFL